MSGTPFEVYHASRRAACVQFDLLLSIGTIAVHTIKFAPSGPEIPGTTTFNLTHPQTSLVRTPRPEVHVRLPMILSHPMEVF